MADGGTIFLDEIGELSPLLQVKLLRFSRNGKSREWAVVKPYRWTSRVIAATNRPLEEEIADGRFREDLFYRLNVFPVHLPPLRERRGDVMLLADHFVEKYSKKNRKTVKRISSSAIDLLTSYHWPGNVRELENCMERAVLLSTDEVVHAYHLPPSLQSAESTDTGLASSLPEALDKLEEELIRTLSNHPGAIEPRPPGIWESPSGSWVCGWISSESNRKSIATKCRISILTLHFRRIPAPSRASVFFT
jgi:Nif-specific regulatory protein